MPTPPADNLTDLLARVEHVHIAARRKVDQLLLGQYHSAFRGQGMEFDEVREYQPGDDIRFIDWNVTARTNVPHIKRFREERELSVVFLVDCSASSVFGSKRVSKFELMLELTAVLMFSAIRNNDRVGLVLYSDEVDAYFKPKRGKGNVLRLIRELLSARPKRAVANVTTALRFLSRVIKKKAVAFVVSDFHEPPDVAAARQASRKHELIALSVDDPRESQLVDIGLATFVDPETMQLVEVDTGSARVRERFANLAKARSHARDRMLHQAGIDHLHVTAGHDYRTALRTFFARREEARRGHVGERSGEWAGEPKAHNGTVNVDA